MYENPETMRQLVEERMQTRRRTTTEWREEWCGEIGEKTFDPLALHPRASSGCDRRQVSWLAGQRLSPTFPAPNEAPVV